LLLLCGRGQRECEPGPHAKRRGPSTVATHLLKLWRRDSAVRGVVATHLILSTTQAIAWPKPMHIVASP
jgi:hypothetical protein